MFSQPLLAKKLASAATFYFLGPCLSFVGSLWINKLHLTAPVQRSASRVVGEKILGNITPKVFPNVDSKAIQTNIHFIGRFPSSSVLLLLQLSFRARLALIFFSRHNKNSLRSRTETRKFYSPRGISVEYLNIGLITFPIIWL